MKNKSICLLAGILFPYMVMAQSPEMPGRLDSLKNLVDKLNDDHQYDSCLVLSQEIEKLAFEEQVWEDYILYQLAQYGFYNELDEFEKASEVLGKSEKEAKKYLAPEHEYIFYLKNNLGVDASNQGNFLSAISQYKEALAFTDLDNENPLNHSRRVLSLINLGNAYADIGDKERALLYYQEAWIHIEDSLALKAYQEDAKWIQFDLGFTKAELKKYEESNQHYKRAIALYEEEESPNLIGLIRNQLGIASNYLEAKQTEKAKIALEKLSQYQALYKQQKGEDYKKDDFLIALARLRSMEGSFSEAHTLLQKADPYLEEKYGSFPKHPMIGLAHIRQADIYEAEQKYKEALISCQKAFSQYCNFSDGLDIYKHPGIEQIDFQTIGVLRPLIRKPKFLYNLYLESQEIKALEAAYESSQLLVEVVQQFHNIFQGDASSLFLQQRVLPAYEQAIRIGIHAYQKTKDETYAEGIFQLMESSKAILLNAFLNEEQVKLDAQIPDSLRHQLKELDLDIYSLKHKIFVEEQKLEPNAEKLTQYEQEVFEQEREKEKLLERLAEAFPQYHELRHNKQTISLKAFQAESRDEESWIEFFWGEDSVYAALIEKEKFVPFSLGSIEDVKARLIPFLDMIRNPASSLSDFSETGYALYQILFFPIREQIGAHINEVGIIPDGLLAYLPFQVLLERNEPTRSFGDLPYVFKSYPISYAYSLTSSRRSKNFKQGRELKAFASFAPAYEGSLSLSFNQKESQRIAEMNRGKAFLGAEASLANFLHEAPNYRIIHLAMHGLADTLNPMNAHLIFHNEEKPEIGEKLYAYDLYQLDLNNELTVLSACETGYGKLSRGEGIMSLARTFRQIGAKSVLMSLWEADGKASMDLTQEFYKLLLEGKDKSEALNLSIGTYLASSPPEFEHPYYWANFVLVGDDSAMNNKHLSWLVFTMIALVILLVGAVVWKRSVN